MKKRKPANFNYDFTGLAVEVTGDDLYLINGGAEVENSHQGVANAQVGDTITRSNGQVVTLNQGDIKYAQDQLGISGPATDAASPTPTPNTTPTPNVTMGGAGAIVNNSIAPGNQCNNRIPVALYVI